MNHFTLQKTFRTSTSTVLQIIEGAWQVTIGRVANAVFSRQLLESWWQDRFGTARLTAVRRLAVKGITLIS